MLIGDQPYMVRIDGEAVEFVAKLAKIWTEASARGTKNLKLRGKQREKMDFKILHNRGSSLKSYVRWSPPAARDLFSNALEKENKRKTDKTLLVVATLHNVNFEKLDQTVFHGKKHRHQKMEQMGNQQII